MSQHPIQQLALLRDSPKPDDTHHGHRRGKLIDQKNHLICQPHNAITC